MQNLLQKIACDMVEYIELTAPLLEKSAQPETYLDEFDTQEYRVKLAEAVDRMAEQQLIPLHARREVYDEFLSRPEKVAEALCKLSGKVGPHNFGDVSDRTDAQNLDPILQFILS